MTNVRIPRARRTDPSTSKQGEHDVARRATPQMMRLLLTYLDAPRTDEEAAFYAGMQLTGYWKRCSDLRRLGYIEPVKIGEKELIRKGSTGSMQRVCRITDDGREELHRRELT